jgi:mono/diheme cytochrome c family protein
LQLSVADLAEDGRMARLDLPSHLFSLALAFLSLLLASLLVLMTACTEQKAADRIAAREQSPKGDTNTRPGTPESPPYSPALPPAPPPAEAQVPAPTPEAIAKATAPPAAREPETVDWSGGDPHEGREIYGMYCAMCHGADGAGKGPGAAALNPKPRDFTSGAFSFDANANNQTGEDVDIARVIREGPHAFGGSSSMPAWKSTFTEDQVRDLVAYVHQLASASNKGG